MKPDASIPVAPSSDLAQMTIICDTREQRPWHFPEEYATMRRGTLKYGDYALDGDSWAIERKSMSDFVGTVSAQWDRFCRELEKMPPLPQRTIIVEGSMIDIIEGNYNGASRPKYIMHRIAQLTLMGVSVLFCESETLSAVMAYRLFRRRHAFLNNVEECAPSAE